MSNHTIAKETLIEARRMSHLGFTQAQFRRKFKDVTGQKLYYLTVLDNRFPKLRIIDRILNDELRYEPLHFAALIRIGTQTDPDRLARHNDLAKRALNEPLPEMTEEEVAKWFNKQ